MKEISQEKIQQLVELSKDKNQTAFQELYEIFYPKIMLYVATKIPLIEVENLVANIWLIIVDEINEHQNKGGKSFAVWSFRIANNEIINFYRRKKIALGVDFSSEKEQENSWENLPDDLLSPELSNFFENEKDRENHQNIGKLPAEQRIIAELNLMFGFSLKEIAEIIGKTQKHISTQQARGWQSLRNNY
jgi:RNA polymerase sigma factor (sigma-70 family)